MVLMSRKNASSQVLDAVFFPIPLFFCCQGRFGAKGAFGVLSVLTLFSGAMREQSGPFLLSSFFLTNCELFLHSSCSHCVFCSNACNPMPLTVREDVPELRISPAFCLEGNSTAQS